MPRSVKGDILYPFATLSLIAVVLVGVALAYLIRSEIETRTRDSAAELTANSVVAVLQPQVNGLDLQTPLSGAPYDALQQAVSQNVLSGETLRLRIYNREGVAVYSSEPSEVGRALASKEDMLAALGEQTVGKTADGMPSADGAGVGSVGPVLRVYTPLYSSTNHEVAATVEIYSDFTSTSSSIAAAQRFSYLYIGLGLLVLYVVLQAGVFGVTRALAKDHARLSYLYQTGEHVRSSLDLQEVLSQIVRDSRSACSGRLQHGVPCRPRVRAGRKGHLRSRKGVCFAARVAKSTIGCFTAYSRPARRT